MADTVNRFSNRVENYMKYRPGYPPQLIALLQEKCGLTPQSLVADIGSGTGMLSELLLKNGNTVFGVEPGREMRAAAERLLRNYENFKSIDGKAEQTGLPSGSVDLITAAQAFHWFDQERARLEFVRILKPNGWVALIWNERRLDSSQFLVEYENLLLTYGTDYQEVRHENVRDSISTFFAPEAPAFTKFDNVQLFDLEGFRGRVASASYTPEPGTTNYEQLFSGLKDLFVKHAVNGKIRFEYDTTVYYGRLPQDLK
jgi:SAM-dependent methyltransferase